jgi:hypothetical protein
MSIDIRRKTNGETNSFVDYSFSPNGIPFERLALPARGRRSLLAGSASGMNARRRKTRARGPPPLSVTDQTFALGLALGSRL